MDKFIIGMIVLEAAVLVTVCGNAEVYIHFETYDNPEGTTRKGRCCDGWPILCEHGCDYFFRVCLDDIDGPLNTKRCTYGFYRTGKAFDDQRNVVFGEDIGGIKNPLHFHIPGTIDKMVELKVDVKDKDNFGRSDYIDYLSGDIWLYKGVFDEVRLPLDLISRTRLGTVVHLKCSEDWYGENCGTFCPKPRSDDHFDCDQKSGKQICHPGWFGSTCNLYAVGQKPKERRTSH